MLRFLLAVLFTLVVISDCQAQTQQDATDAQSTADDALSWAVADVGMANSMKNSALGNWNNVSPGYDAFRASAHTPSTVAIVNLKTTADNLMADGNTETTDGNADKTLGDLDMDDGDTAYNQQQWGNAVSLYNEATDHYCEASLHYCDAYTFYFDGFDAYGAIKTYLTSEYNYAVGVANTKDAAMLTAKSNMDSAKENADDWWTDVNARLGDYANAFGQDAQWTNWNQEIQNLNTNKYQPGETKEDEADDHKADGEYDAGLGDGAYAYHILNNNWVKIVEARDHYADARDDFVAAEPDYSQASVDFDLAADGWSQIYGEIDAALQ